VELYENIRLDGTGYVELPREAFQHSNAQPQEIVEMTVITREPEAMLLWQASKANEPLKSNDYVTLLIQNGHVVFR